MSGMGSVRRLGFDRVLTGRAVAGTTLVGSLLLIAPIAVLSLLAWQTLGKAPQGTVTHFLILTVALLAFSLFTGNSGILSFGHVAFMGLAAHVTGALTIPVAQKAVFLPDLPPWLAQTELGFLPAAAVAIVCVTAVAFLVGLPIARLNGSSAAIATLGLLIIVYGVIVGARDFTRGSQVLVGVPKTVDIPVALAFLAAAVLLARLFRDSLPGLELRAVREDEPAARAIGVDAPARRLFAWTLSASLAAAAGVLLAHYLGVYSPKEFYFQLTFAILAMLIVGGMTSVSGAVVGAVAISVLVELLRGIEERLNADVFREPTVFGLTDIGLSLAILGMLFWRRDGLFGFWEIEELAARRWRRFRPRRGAAPGTVAPRRVRPEGALVVDRVSKAFGGLRAVDAASLALVPGEIVGLIGPNGSGKTTLLGCISGALEADEGSIGLDGADITRLPAHRIARRHVGRTFQNVRLFGNLSVADNVKAALAASGTRLDPAAMAGLAHALLDELGIGSYGERRASTLPYGLQRRLEIARALALEPRYLLLDEPAAGMNETESDELLAVLAGLRESRGLCLLVVDHDLRLIMRLCDRVVVLNRGRVIAEGAPREVQADPGVVEAYLGRRRAAVRRAVAPATGGSES